jgi:ribonuclease R
MTAWLFKETGGGSVLRCHCRCILLQPGSALDQEAEQRGTSVYFPHSVLPMLPPEVSTGICSLNPEVDRLAVTVILHFNRTGKVQKTEFARAVIRSQARLTYDEVEQILQGDRRARRGRGAGEDADADGGSLRAVEEQRRRGSLLLTIPEAEVLLNEQYTIMPGWIIAVPSAH